MVQEIDIYRTAKVMIDHHGDQALVQAMSRIEAFRKTEDQAGMKTWERIADAIEWMQSDKDLVLETSH